MFMTYDFTLTFSQLENVAVISVWQACTWNLFTFL